MAAAITPEAWFLTARAVIIPMNLLASGLSAGVCFTIARLQTTRPEERRLFLYTGIGWSVNVVYVLIEIARRTAAASLLNIYPGLSRYSILLANAATGFFFAAAALEFLFVLSPRRSVVLASLSALATLALAHLLDQSHVATAAIAFLPSVVVLVLALICLGLAFRKLVRSETGLSASPAHLLYLSLILYAGLQFLYLAVPHPPSAASAKPPVPATSLERVVDTVGATPWEIAGFTIALVLKLAHLIGLVRFSEFRLLKTAQRDAQNLVADTSRREIRALATAHKRTIGEFIHEVKTPSAQLRLAFNTLERHAITRGSVREATEATQKALILVLASLEGGYQLFDMEEHAEFDSDASSFIRYSANSALQAALIAVRSRYKQADRNLPAKITTEYTANAQISCSPPDLIRVFINLIRNALDSVEALSEASGNSGSNPRGRLHLRTRRIKDGEHPRAGWLECAVLDSGQGVKPELRERIFDLGFTTRSGPTRGFGLKVAKRIVGEHLGELIIEDAALSNFSTVAIVMLPPVELLPTAPPEEL